MTLQVSGPARSGEPPAPVPGAGAADPHPPPSSTFPVWSWPRRYAFAVLASAAALAVHLALRDLVGPLPPFLVFFTAIAVTAIWSGWRGTLIATVLSALFADLFLLEPVNRPGIERTADRLALGLFVLNGLLFTVLAKWREAREELRARQARFDVSQRLATLLHALPVGVAFSHDAECRHVTGNQAMLDLLEAGEADNLSPCAGDEGAVGRRVRYVQEGRPLQPGDLPLQRALAEERLIEPSAFEVLLPSGRRWWAEALAAPIRDAGGRVSGAVAVTMDVTARKQAEEALRESARQLDVVNRLKDEFLSTLSHELRTPLNAILGWSSLLARGQLDETAARQAIEIIQRNGRAQAAIVDDVLDASNMVSGRLRLDVGTADLGEVLGRALEAVAPAAAARGIRLDRSTEGDLTLAGDPARLQQVFWNLLSNAVKFTPEGGHVRATARRTASGIEVEVSDDGAGIAPESLPFLFQRFWQADGSAGRRHGGLGLGLAIARHLVELHGGEVKAESDGLGRGTRFTVTLPAVAPHGPAREVESRGEEPTDPVVDPAAA